MTDEQILEIVGAATKHLHDANLIAQVGKEIRALLARQPAAIDKQEESDALYFALVGAESQLRQIAKLMSEGHEFIDKGRTVEMWADMAKAVIANEASKPAAPSVERDERGAFEKFWVRDVSDAYRNMALDNLAKSRSGDGVYGNAKAQAAWEGWQARAASTSANVAQGAKLSVWYGSMPESNGKTNWTAILHKGDIAEGITIDRSEYPDRVRYEADRMRWMIGEIDKKPWILDYDADKHSGYVANVAQGATSHERIWLENRANIISAINAAGFELSSNKDGWWLAKRPADKAAALAANVAQGAEAWVVYWGIGEMRKNSVHFERETAEKVAAQIKSNTEIRPLYAAPPAQTAITDAASLSALRELVRLRDKRDAFHKGEGTWTGDDEGQAIAAFESARLVLTAAQSASGDTK